MTLHEMITCGLAVLALLQTVVVSHLFSIIKECVVIIKTIKEQSK